MPTSPQRRHRIRRAHQLRQHGHTLRSIAQQLGTSHSTIAEDLKRFETHRQEITTDISHDLQLEHTLQLRDRLHHLYAQDPLHPLQRYPLTDAQGRNKTRAAEATTSEIIRLYSLHQRAITQAEREYRHALQELAHADINSEADTLDYPDDQLAAPAQPAPPAQLTQPDQKKSAQPRTQPNKPEQIRTTPTTAEHAKPAAKPAKSTQTQPAHPQTQPTKPDQNRTTPTTAEHPQPQLTYAQLGVLLETDPPDLDALNNLLQHPERLPPLPPDILDLFKQTIASVVNAA